MFSQLIAVALLSSPSTSTATTTDRTKEAVTPASKPKAKGLEIVKGLRALASFRMRYEVRDDFALSEGAPIRTEDFLLTRLRVGLDWAPVSWFSARVEGQDAHILGGVGISDTAIPSVNEDSFDLHQAFMQFNVPSQSWPVMIKVGRQKLNFGKQRLVGALEWVNTARVADALRVTMGPKAHKIDLFAARYVPPRPRDFDSWETSGNRYFDSELYGLYYSAASLIPSTTLQLYALARRNDRIDDLVGTVGVRLVSKYDRHDWDLEIAGQYGEMGGADHASFAGHAGYGYSFKFLEGSRVNVAYSVGMGDDDPNDGESRTFDNLFHTNHMHYGAMDFFSWKNMHDLEAGWQVKLLPNVSFAAGYHAFFLFTTQDKWYGASGAPRNSIIGADSSYVGSEVDVTLKTKVFDGRAAFMVGYSHFFAGAYLDTVGQKTDADFVFLQGMVRL